MELVRTISDSGYDIVIGLYNRQGNNWGVGWSGGMISLGLLAALTNSLQQSFSKSVLSPLPHMAPPLGAEGTLAPENALTGSSGNGDGSG